MTKTKKQNQFRKNNRTQKKVRKNRRKQTNKFRKNRRKQNKLRKSQRGGIKIFRNMMTGKTKEIKGMSALDTLLNNPEPKSIIDVLFKFRALKDGTIRTMYFLIVSPADKRRGGYKYTNYFLVTMDTKHENIHAVYKVKGSVDEESIRKLSESDKITRTKPVHALSQIRTIYYMRNMSKPGFLCTLENMHNKYYAKSNAIPNIMKSLYPLISINPNDGGVHQLFEFPDHELPRPGEDKDAYKKRMKDNVPGGSRPPYKSIDASITDICESHNCENLGEIKTLNVQKESGWYNYEEGYHMGKTWTEKEDNTSSWMKEKYNDTDGTRTYLYEGTKCFEQKVAFQTDNKKVEFTILDFYPLVPHEKSELFCKETTNHS